MFDAVAVKLGGKEYTIRPTFGTLVQIERRCGPVLKLIQRIQTPGDIGVGEIAGVLHEAINATITAPKEKFTFEEIGELVFEEGFVEFVTPVAEFLANALRAGPEEPVQVSGEDKSDKQT